MRSAFALLAVTFTIGILPAQTPLSGPVEGFTFDLPTRGLRGIIGMLGSASLGPAVWSNLDYASVAPHKNYAIAFQEGRALIVSSLDSDQIAPATLPGSFSVPEGIAWSGDGSLAVLYSRTGNWVQTISGLPSSPNAGSPLDVSSLGTLLAVASDLRGEHIAIAMVGDSSGVFQISGDQSFRPLLSVSKPISLAFTDDGGKLYVLDGASKQLSEVSMADLTTQTWPVPELEDPIAVIAARDATQRAVIYLAGGSDRSLIAYDLSSHELIAGVSLTFQPTGIEPLGKDSYLLRPRLNTDDPLWSFRNSTQPVVYFVPATPLFVSEDSSR
jgi:DNA-binding beta-propeller fold protein YncE